MAHSIDEPIIEGFICPSCMAVFQTADILHIHFSKEHSSNCDSVNNDSSRPNPSTTATQAVQNYAFFEQGNSNQSLGCTRSCTSELKHWRDIRVSRDAVETNTLLLRLEKLICIPPLNKIEQREAEQTVVPWIDAKVDLCPSCGSRFGLSAEDHNTQHPESLLDNRVRAKKPSITQLTKTTLATIGNAILDYNPVYRRRHHCRLCGHVICADCSCFLDRKSGVQLMQLVDQNNFGRHSGPRKETSDMDSFTCESNLVQFTHQVNETPSLLDLDRDPSVAASWRVCNICKHLIEKKARRLTERHRIHPVVQLHADMKNLMNKVNETMPSYSTIANSLHSGEQRYDLEMAKTTRHELLDWLQQIDQLRRRVNQLEATGGNTASSGERPNLALIRLVRAINTVAAHFLQTYIPPLRVLPTTKQYDSLTAQRQDQLATRWAEEERTIAELEKCLLDSRRNSPKNSISSSPSSSIGPTSRKQAGQVTVDDLSRLAARIDEASVYLMSAKRSANRSQINAWTKELNKLESEYQSISRLLQFNP